MDAKKLISAVLQLAVAVSAMGQAAAAPENPAANGAQASAPSAAPAAPAPTPTPDAGNAKNDAQAGGSTVTRQQVIDELYAARKNGDIIRNEADYDVANFKTRHATDK